MGILRFGNRRKTAASDNPASSGVCILPKKLRWRRRNGNMPHPPRFLPSRHQAHGYHLSPGGVGARPSTIRLSGRRRPPPPLAAPRAPPRPPPIPPNFQTSPSFAAAAPLARDRRSSADSPPLPTRPPHPGRSPRPPPGPLLREIVSLFAMAAAGGAPHRVPHLCCFRSSLHPASVRRLSADHDDVISSMIL